MVESTLITRGKNKGKLKEAMTLDSFDRRSANGLIERKLIRRYEDGSFSKDNWIATPEAFNFI